MSRLRQLGKDSLVYGLGAVLAKSMAFFLLPVFTRIFPPAQYGAIEMLTAIASFVSALLAMGMDSAQSFYFFEQKDQGRAAQARLVSAILQWRLTWGLAIVGTIIILKICDATLGLRVNKEEETQGLDLSQHGEEGYIYEG